MKRTSRMCHSIAISIDGSEALEALINKAETDLLSASTTLDDPDFPRPSQDALDVARDLARRILSRMLSSSDTVPAPVWEASADGGVDLHWYTQLADVLVAVPHTRDEPIEYHGDTRNGSIAKGSAPVRDSAKIADVIAVWLVQFT